MDGPDDALDDGQARRGEVRQQHAGRRRDEQAGEAAAAGGDEPRVVPTPKGAKVQAKLPRKNSNNEAFSADFNSVSGGIGDGDL